VDVIVYVETNFLMSVAMGREANGNNLLAAVSDSVRVAIPSGCYMESFSAFEDEKKRRVWFKTELDKQIGQLQRDTTSTNAGALVKLLEESRIANNHLVNDVESRLFQLVNRAASAFDPIATTPEVLQAAVGQVLIPDPTDNLILHSIIDHTAYFSSHTKVMLTDNAKDFGKSEVQAALAAVGISKSFRAVTNLLGWLGSLSH
jgi:hypothetical protein